MFLREFSLTCCLRFFELDHYIVRVHVWQPTPLPLGLTLWEGVDGVLAVAWCGALGGRFLILHVKVC